MNFDRLYELALKRLARRERSLEEMRGYLEQKSGQDFQDLVDQVLQRLVSLKYLDEERLAGALIRDQRLQSRGPRSAWLKLKKRGVQGWSLERVEQVWREGEHAELLEAGVPDEVETARRWVLRRYRGLVGRVDSLDREARSEWQRERQRALAALVRRGYSLSIAMRALDFRDPD